MSVELKEKVVFVHQSKEKATAVVKERAYFNTVCYVEPQSLFCFTRDELVELLGDGFEAGAAYAFWFDNGNGTNQRPGKEEYLSSILNINHE